MKRLSIMAILILPIMISCTSAEKKETVFYSENEKFSIPLCLNKEGLCVDPTDLLDANRGINPRPIPKSISNSLSDFGTVIGEIGVFYSPGGGYLDSTQQYYIVHDENFGNLYTHKNNRFQNNFSEKRLIVTNNKLKEVTEYFHISGESDGLAVDLDLYNSQIINDGKTILMHIQLKNTSSIKKTFNTATDKINFYMKDIKSKKKIENQLYLYNNCSKSIINSIKEIEPGEVRDYYVKADFKNENESIGIQMAINFTRISVDNVLFDKGEAFKKSADMMKAIWGGNFQIGENGKVVPLDSKILVTTVTEQ